MLQPADRLRLDSAVEIPSHLEEFAATATHLLSQAHETGLTLSEASVRVRSDDQADRLYIERHEAYHLDRELLAIHLGRAGQWLSVSFSHSRRTMADQQYEYAQNSVVIQSAGSRVFSQSPTRMGPESDITDSEIAGRQYTNRLYRAFGGLGIYNTDQVARNLLKEAS